MITLPKDWANSVGLNKNDTISVQAQADGTLVLCPKGSLPTHKRSTKIIDVTNIKSKEFFNRQLVGAYIAGHTTILIKSAHPMSKDVTSTVSNFVRDAIGMEMIEADESHILIANLIEQDAIDTRKIIDRMGSLVKEMLSDTYAASMSGDLSKIKNMEARDTEVDRIYWLTFRQYNMAHKEAQIETDDNAHHKVTTCLFVGRVLESVGDHSVTTSDYIKKLTDKAGPIVIDKRLQSYTQRTSVLLAKALKAWIDMDINSAEQVIKESHEISKDCERAIANGPINEHNVLDGIMVLSAKRVSELCKIVAEYTFDLSMD
jgi:phosphate uptake regulator